MLLPPRTTSPGTGRSWKARPKFGAWPGLVIDYMRGFIAEKPKLAAILSYTRVVAAWDMGFDRVCRGAPHVIVAHSDKNRGFGAEDTALALSYLELYAPVLGLGSCWAGVLLHARQRPSAAVRSPEAASET